LRARRRLRPGPGLRRELERLSGPAARWGSTPACSRLLAAGSRRLEARGNRASPCPSSCALLRRGPVVAAVRAGGAGRRPRSRCRAGRQRSSSVRALATSGVRCRASCGPNADARAPATQDAPWTGQRRSGTHRRGAPQRCLRRSRLRHIALPLEQASPSCRLLRRQRSVGSPVSAAMAGNTPWSQQRLRGGGRRLACCSRGGHGRGGLAGCRARPRGAGARCGVELTGRGRAFGRRQAGYQGRLLPSRSFGGRRAPGGSSGFSGLCGTCPGAARREHGGR